LFWGLNSLECRLSVDLVELVRAVFETTYAYRMWLHL
jgi:hypothetical protein